MGRACSDCRVCSYCRVCSSRGLRREGGRKKNTEWSGDARISLLEFYPLAPRFVVFVFFAPISFCFRFFFPGQDTVDHGCTVCTRHAYSEASNLGWIVRVKRCHSFDAVPRLAKTPLALQLRSSAIVRNLCAHIRRLRIVASSPLEPVLKSAPA